MREGGGDKAKGLGLQDRCSAWRRTDVDWNRNHWSGAESNWNGMGLVR